MAELLIFGLPAVGLIIVLVNLGKKYGLGDRWAPLAALGVGVLFSVLGRLAALYPTFATWYEVVIGGLVAGLVAAGLYSGQKAIRNNGNGNSP